MAQITELSRLLSPLASSAQLETSASQLDGLPKDLEDSVRFETARLVQAAGILLRLPQELIAHSIVILQRYLVGPDGGGLLEYNPKDVAGAALYLTAKPTNSVSTRQLLTVFEFLTTIQPKYSNSTLSGPSDGFDWKLSEGSYEAQRSRLYVIESQILRTLGFQTHVALPYTLCINYLQTLEVFQSSDGTRLAKRAFAHLNGAPLSPQMLCLTHQPSELAVAAIYLAAKDVGVKLPEVEWWEVFDVDREELGFLVVALRSLESFALEERRKWGQRNVPLTVDQLRAELQSKRRLEDGEQVPTSQLAW